MPWYVIQTYTGREEQLVRMIRRQVPDQCYGQCFVAYYEQLRDRKQENQIHILRLFPGYIFISCNDIILLFRHLKMIPVMSKIISTGAFVFTPLHKEEVEFLLHVIDTEHIVRLTYVATDGRDHVSYLSGPLDNCRDRIQSYRFRDRYAKVKLKIAGEEKIVRMGIILNDDVRREMKYGKVEVPTSAPEEYKVSALKKPLTGLGVGDQVAVLEGAFEGIVAVVRQMKGDIAKISVHMFGREILLEISVDNVRKLTNGRN